MTTIKKRKHDDDDDDRILRDGERMRVPLTLMDGMQRDVAQHFQRARVRDAAARRFGLSDGLALSRPGFRYVVDDAALDAVEQAYADIAARDVNAWKNPAGGQDTTREFIAQRDALSTMDEREAAYQEYDDHMTNAWRGK
jgi:hypothetical protein